MTAIASPLSGFQARVDECNNGLAHSDEMMPFRVGASQVGYLRKGFAKVITDYHHVFTARNEGNAAFVTLSEKLDTLEKRTEAVAGVLQDLRAKGVIKGWRDEYYPVTSDFHTTPVLLMERAAVPFFGVRAYGVHVNGYVETKSGLELWVARRSASKPTWPGLLDHIVAGGQPHGISCEDNVVKECLEEASISQELARAAKAVGLVSYVSLTEEGLKPDVLFCYDLKLPEDFVPQPQDGEVEEFMRWPISRVAEVVSCTQEYKPNCNLVVIDFLIRHGYITPDQLGYVQLVKSLRSFGDN